MSKSKLLILNGSPNKNGYTAQLLNTLFNTYNPIQIDAYKQTIHPCDDCKVCHYKTQCKFTDDMESIKKTMINCDTLVIASPIYFGALTDSLLRIINRFQQLFEAKFTHNKPFTTFKNIILISTAASPNDTMFDGAKLTINILKSLFSAENVLSLTLGDTDTINDIVKHYETTIINFKVELKKAMMD